MIGDAQISLGMSRRDVIQLFKKAGLQPTVVPQLAKSPTEEHWTICESSNPNAANCTIEGSVIFEHGILVLASVRWGAGADSGSAVAGALVGALHHLAQSRDARCEVGTDTQDDPSFRIRRARIRCGDHHTVSVFVTQDADGTQSGQVQEIISEKVLTLESK